MKFLTIENLKHIIRAYKGTDDVQKRKMRLEAHTELTSRWAKIRAFKAAQRKTKAA